MNKLLKSAALSLCALPAVTLIAPTASAVEVPYAAPSDLVTNQGVMDELIGHDHDHDGDIDLYYARSNGAIMLRRQNANGTWSAFTLHTSSDDVRGLVPATVLGTGKRPDLLLSEVAGNGGGVRVLKNDGADNYSSTTVAWANNNIEHVGAAVGDFNRDGRNDIVVFLESPTRNERQVLVYCNYAEPVQYFDACFGHLFTEVRGNPSLVVEDFNRDGWPDFAVVGDQTGSGKVHAYRNTSASGTFGFNATESSTWFRGASDLIAADVDRDGAPDLLATLPASGQVRVITGPPRGANYLFGEVYTLPGSVAGARALEAADLDFDGDLDVAVAAEDAGRTVWYENDRVSGQWLSRNLQAVAASDPNGIAVADFDRDGDIDIVTTRSGSGSLQIERNIDLHRSVVFGSREIVSSNHVSYGPRVFDVNRDGRNDIVASARLHGNANTTYQDVFLQQADGSLSNVGRTVSKSQPVGAGLAIADINRDGLPDWAFAQNVSAGAERLLQAANGVPALDGSWAGAAREALLVDIDHDGDVDFISNSPTSGALTLFRHTGVGAIYGAAESLNTDDAWDLALADLDRDGWVDLLYSSRSSASSVPTQIAWMRNLNGVLQAPEGWNTGGRTAGRIDIADINKDGTLDVVASGSMSGANGVELGRPFWVSGASGHAITDIAAQDETRPLLVDAEDIDHDGDVDVLLTPGGSNALPILYEQLSPTSFRRSELNGPAATLYSAKWGDLNGDGWPDLLWSGVGLGLRWAALDHGQFGLLPEFIGSPQPASGVASVLLKVDVAHLGRIGESAAQMQSIVVELLDAADDSPLTAAEAQSMWTSMELWHDLNQDGVFSMTAPPDQLLSSHNLSSPAPQFSFSLPVIASSPKTLYLVARYTEAAGSLPWKAKLRVRSELAAARHNTALSALRILPMNYVSAAIDVVDTGSPPVFTAAGPFTIGTAATNGSLVGDMQAHDGDGGGNDVGITYSIVGGNGASLFSIEAAGGRLRVANGSALTPGTRIVRVRASDASQSTEVDVSVQINPTRPPVFTHFGPYNLDEYASNNQLVGDVNAHDGDGGAADVGIQYSILSQPSPARFSIEATTGVIRLGNNTGLAQGQTYTITVAAHDGAAQAPRDVVINVVDGNDPPVVIDGGPFATYIPAQIGDLVGDINASDGDGGPPDQNVAYVLIGGSGEPYFAVDLQSGVITHAAPAGLQSGSYELQVRLVDGPWMQTISVLIQVEQQPVVGPPVFVDYGPYSFQLGTINGGLIGDINAISRVGGAPDEGVTYALQPIGSYRHFAVNAEDGRLMLADGNGLRAGDQLRIDVDAMSSGGTTRQRIGINVVGSGSEPIFVQSGPFDVDEYSPAEAIVGDVDAQIGDGGTPDQNISYSIVSGTANALFEIDADSGEIRLSRSAGLQQGQIYNLRVRATSSQGGSSEALVQMSIVDGDDAPVFIASGPFSVRVGAASGAVIGDVDAVDGDGGAADHHLSYALTGGADIARFSISATDGRLTIANSDGLVAGSTLQLWVSASDARSTVQTEVSIAITTANAAPVFDHAGPYQVQLPIQNGAVVGQLQAHDDGGVLSYHLLGGSGAALYSLDSASGMIRVLDAQALTAGRVDSLLVELRDGELSASASVQLNVLSASGGRVFHSGFE
ncbi:surface glycan-binding family protein [Pseudomarimonas arenosa]|uniref:DUF4958 family protein n=1 Tax=Pseudomarimonas arenosa TaxID=2774145 RepID=A0AAW3ZR24_9GAMM|nr:surface glycan-binding family protein [Pseudomarimonas arenosa]MBD8527069.1 DUF4958 family protein [Pseudomarimonas arenosa]